jgi:histidinol-phosphate/aromatic aminotransferase/cobyric acid decarboxylase-like protein
MGGPRFPIAMASHINKYFKPFHPVKPEQIITASGLTAIHELMACSLGDPGDGILVSRPVYGRFELDFGNTANLKIVYADMEGVDPFGAEVVPKHQAALETALKENVKVKALLIVNPHNPLGKKEALANIFVSWKFDPRF